MIAIMFFDSSSDESHRARRETVESGSGVEPSPGVEPQQPAWPGQGNPPRQSPKGKYKAPQTSTQDTPVSNNDSNSSNIEDNVAPSLEILDYHNVDRLAGRGDPSTHLESSVYLAAVNELLSSDDQSSSSSPESSSSSPKSGGSDDETVDSDDETVDIDNESLNSYDETSSSHMEFSSSDDESPRDDREPFEDEMDENLLPKTHINNSSLFVGPGQGVPRRPLGVLNDLPDEPPPPSLRKKTGLEEFNERHVGDEPAKDSDEDSTLSPARSVGFPTSAPADVSQEMASEKYTTDAQVAQQPAPKTRKSERDRKPPTRYANGS